MIFYQSKNIEDYKNLIRKLSPVFGKEFKYTVKCWCNDDYDDDCYWNIWLVEKDNEIIGICGLYSHDRSTKNLWLGWLGIIPKYRNLKLGSSIMKHLYKECKKVKCENLYSYVDKDGRPLNFYFKENFKIIDTVKGFLKKNNIDRDYFEDLNDHIIHKKLL